MSHKANINQSVKIQVSKTPRIAKVCTENLTKCLSSGRMNDLPDIFDTMVNDAIEHDLPTATLAIGLHENSADGVLPGQYVTEIHLVIKRFDGEEAGEEGVHSPTE